MLTDLLVLGDGAIELEASPRLNFPHHRVATEYFEVAYNGAIGQSYNFALPPISPSIRQFTLFFETMRYYFNSDGSIDLDTNPQLNIGRLEHWYNTFKLTVPFLYPHPAFGNIWVRFNAPPTIPKGRFGGNGWLEAFSLTLVEQPLNLMRVNDSTSFGADDFEFPHHLVEHRYLPQSTVVPLGGAYSFTVSPICAEQRTFTLSFQTMKFTIDNAGRLDITSNAKVNAGRLLSFYNQYKLHRVFNYNHAVYGKIPVRFNKAIRFPEGLTNGNGYLPSFEVELIEVIPAFFKGAEVDEGKLLAVGNEGGKMLLINGKYLRIWSS